MESYYSSDEEIAWGPLTLREIKGDLKRPIVRKPDRRHTVHYNFQDHKMDDESLSENVNKLDISGTSTTYLTPNETLQTTSTVNIFEKHSHIINVPSPDLSEYVSVLEDTGDSNNQTEESFSQKQTPIESVSNTGPKPCEPIHNDSCMTFIKALENRQTQYDIANFQQTLVENTCILSEEEKESQNSLLNNSSSDEEKLAITISDDSDSSITSNDTEYVNYIEKNFPLKKEIDFDGYKEQHSNDSEYESSVDESSFEKVTSNEIQHKIGNDLDSDSWLRNVGKTCSEGNGQYENPDNFYMSPNIHHKLSVIKESLSTSPVVVPEIDLAQFDDSLAKDESFQLNDTIEEMRRAECQGLNYSISDDEVDDAPLKNQHALNQTFTPLYQQTNENSYSREMRSQIPRPASADRKPIKKDSPNFKVPDSKRITKPTPTKSCPNRLKNIVSPVALYIKSSPRFPLKQNVPQKKLSKVVPSAGAKVKNKENFPEFAEVVYKPSKNQIESTEKHIELPPYLLKLNTKEGQIVKHEGRLRHGLDRCKVSKKLLETDITNSTIDQSLLSDTGDISVLTNKQAFIK